ncbi:MAG: tetratricopeptide repeat protein [Endomicrobiaceae bacterium]|nr:tetratricopeptide repeat protein [Endomicrobiaceae bacterium]
MHYSDQELIKARILKDENKWDDAIKIYCEILKYNKSIEIYKEVAWCLSRAGHYEKSIEYLQILSVKEPKIYMWAYMLGYQYYCLKNWDKAIEYFEKVLNIKQNYFVAKYRLAYAYLQKTGNYKQWTKSEFLKAIGHLRDCHNIWDKFNDSEKKREKATYFSVNFLLGKSLIGIVNCIDEVIKCLQRALSIKDDEDCKYNLSKVYYLNQEYEKAEQNLPICNKYYVIELKAYISSKLGKYDEAIKLIKQLLNNRKKDYLYRFLSETYLLLNDVNSAFETILEAIMINQNSHKNYYTLGKIYHKFGLLKEAIKNLDIAISLKQKNYSAIYEECEELKIIIVAKIDERYKDDFKLLEQLKNYKGKSENVLSYGIITKYDNARGFGFIKTKTQEIFFHISNCINKDIKKDDKVNFKIVQSKKGLEGRDVKKEK